MKKGKVEAGVKLLYDFTKQEGLKPDVMIMAYESTYKNISVDVSGYRTEKT